MSEKFFGVDIQKEIAIAFPASACTSMVLKRPVAGTRTTGRVAGGTNPTTVSYTCHGVVTSFSEEEMANAKDVRTTDKKVVIIGKDLDELGIEPRALDTITVGGDIYDVIGAVAGGYRAAWFVQCRDE